MELVLQLLMLFIVINTLLKLSFWKWWQSALFGAVAALFILWTGPFAIMQSKTQLADFLGTPSVMQDGAVLVTIESVIGFAFCLTALNVLFGKKVKRWLYGLHWFPGVLIFPVLFYLLTQTVYSLPGTDFNIITRVSALVVVIMTPLISKGLAFLVPDKEHRIEVHFLVSLFVAIFGLITTVNGKVTYAAAEAPTNWNAVLLAILFFAVTFAIGYAWSKLKWHFISNKNNLK